MSRRDWIYLLSLLIPFIVYDLVLKGDLVASWPKDLGLTESLKLMRSDLLFALGYALLWVGLFATARKGLSRHVVVGLFHMATVFVALVSAFAYQYFKVTGSTLDSGFILFSLSSPKGLVAVVESETSPGMLALIFVVLAYAFFGSWLITRMAEQGRLSVAHARLVETPWLRLAGVAVGACVLFSFSLLPGGSGGIARPGKSFSLDSFVNVAITATEAADSEAFSGFAADAPPAASLLPAAGSEQRRNVVLVHLESTRAQSVTPYNEDLGTTPFLNELGKESLLAERAYAVVPHTTNAMVASNCGIDPPLNPWQTS